MKIIIEGEATHNAVVNPDGAIFGMKKWSGRETLVIILEEKGEKQLETQKVEEVKP